MTGVSVGAAIAGARMIVGEAVRSGREQAAQELKEEASKAQEAGDEAVDAYRRNGGALGRLRSGEF